MIRSSATANSAPQAAPTAAQTLECAERAGRIALMLERGAEATDAEARRIVCMTASALCSELQKALGARADGAAEHAHAVAANAAALEHCAERLQTTDAEAAFVVGTAAEALGKTALSMLGAIGRPAQ